MYKTLAACSAALLLSGAAMAQTAAAPAATPATPPPVAPPAAAPPTTAPGAGTTMGMPAMGAGAKSAPMAPSTPANLSKADQNFIMKAGSAGLSVVQEAQLAQQKSQNQKVKDFAQQMITDHTANNQQLATLAQQKGVTVPTSFDQKDQAQYDRLSKLDGAKFDKVYLKRQVKDHENILKLMEREAKNGKDPDLKSFAEQSIPVIQKHLDMAKADTGS